MTVIQFLQHKYLGKIIGLIIGKEKGHHDIVMQPIHINEEEDNILKYCLSFSPNRYLEFDRIATIKRKNSGWIFTTINEYEFTFYQDYELKIFGEGKLKIDDNSET
jgi:hypothetical protein